VVWEEIIIYLPARVSLLLLSATLANAKELADWLAHVRGQPCQVVLAQDRPVPLKALFMALDGEVWPLTSQGRLSPAIRHLLKRPQALSQPLPLNRLLTGLEELDLAPAIFFLTSRAECDQALLFCDRPSTSRWTELQPELNRTIDRFIEEYPFLKGHRLLPYVRRLGVAAHHAGLLPHLKLLVERLMQRGLLRAIFATSTVAAGVNFPARSVVLPQSDRFNGREFQTLTATELTQMTGRAGRRGMDRVGFVVLPPGPHQNLPLLADLLKAPPEPIISQIHLSFSMILNLLLSHTPDQIKPVLSLSLATFQSAGEDRRQRPGFMDKLIRSLKKGHCQEIETAIVQRRRQARLENELDRLRSGWENLEARLRLTSRLTPGRIILDVHGRPWLVKRLAERQDRTGVVAARLGSKIKLRHGRLRLKFMNLEKIGRVCQRVMEDKQDRQLVPELRRLTKADLKPVQEAGPLPAQAQARLDQAQARLERLEAELAASPCPACDLYRECLASPDSSLGQSLDKAQDWLERLAEERHKLWLAFLHRLDFLKAEGFVQAQGELTDQGRWAARLRLDHPLIIAEAIRLEALPQQRPDLLAALMAPFVLDRDRAWPTSVKKLSPDPGLSSAFRRLESLVEPLVRRQAEAGFETPKFRFAPALALFRWANGQAWDELIGAFQVEPGDVASLVFRTADNLRQMAALKDSHPALASSALKAQNLLLKEPVIVPV